MIVKIFASPTDYSLNTLYKKAKNEYLIGVEKGAVYALKNGLKLDLALGDFDSVTEEEKSYIKTHAKKFKAHAIRKDKTDSDLAISEALALNPSRIILYGGIGSRMDHTYGNIMFLKRGNITMVNDVVKMFVLNSGTYGITHSHDYISFFAVEDVKGLTLKGFSFELNAYDLNVDDPLCISNQGQGVVSFEKGKLLVIQSDD